MNKDFIGLKNIPWSYLFKYMTTHRSLFRIYQDTFIQGIGQDYKGSVVEIGGELEYNHKQFFPKSSRFVISNVSRNYEERLDVTDIKYADGTQECYLCTSVLEHVFDFHTAIREMKRTLKTGGMLIVTVPFAFPLHDEVDYWRFTPDSFNRMLDGFKIEKLVHLGGKYSSIAGELQRPKGKLTARKFIPKFIGAVVFMVGKLLESKDNFPSGYAILAFKK